MNQTFYTNVSQSGNNILHRGYENGKRVKFKVPFQPKLYVPSKNNQITKYTTIKGKFLEEISPGGIKDCKEFVKSYESVDGFEIYGNTGWIYQYLASLYPAFEEATYDPKQLRIVNLDIEVESENGFAEVTDPTEKINVITLGLGKQRWLMAIHNFSLPADPNLSQTVYATEEEMLRDFLQLWNEIDADVVTGWNSTHYDLPYLINRIKKLFDEDLARSISPWRSISEDTVIYRGQEHVCYKIAGIALLDYYQLYRKYITTQQESYKLDNIARVELNKSKLDYSEFDSMKEFYNKNFQKFVEYNYQDVNIVSELDEKLNLIDLHISMAYLAKINYEDVFSQVRMWDAIIYNHLLKTGVQVPQKIKKIKDSQFIGAYVKEPVVGMHDWVVSLDAASLYPAIIRLLNIGPDTHIEGKNLFSINSEDLVSELLDKKIDTSLAIEHNCTVSANNQFFTKDKEGFLSRLVDEFLKERKLAKQKMMVARKKVQSIEAQMVHDSDPALRIECENQRKQAVLYDTSQQARKVATNSLYGNLGNQYSRFYDPRHATAITVTGRLVIQWAEKKINSLLNKICKTKDYDYVIAVDTDSNYLRLGNIKQILCPDEKDPNVITSKIDEFCKEILTPYIEKQFEKLGEYLNCRVQTIDMKREVIADRGIWTAKKRYCLNVYDSEGVRYTVPKLKIMGIEVQRSSTPKICRDHLKNCIKLILTKEESDLIEYIDQVRSEFFSASPAQVAFPRGVNSLEEYSDPSLIYKKGTPIAVKGALVYNHLLQKMKLDKKYTSIISGEKIKFLYLKEPNSTGIKVISFPSTIPKEFKLADKVDYNLQFEKTFLDPLTTILDVIGWHSEKTNTLDGFFS